MVNQTGWKQIAMVSAAVFVAGLWGCDDGVIADGDEVVYLTPWGGNEVEASQIRDIPPRLDSQDEANAEEVISNFEAQAEILLERPGVAEILGQIEKSYLLSGNYLQLVDIYRDQFQRHGTDSIAAVALAWTHIQLGNEMELVELEKQLIEERSDDPLTWLIVGEANMRRAAQSQEAAVRARNAFERVLELDPDFQQFKSMDRFRLQEQLDRLRAQVPETLPDDVDEVSAASMHHLEDGEGPQMRADTEGVDIDAEERDHRISGERKDDAQESAEEVVDEIAEETAREAAQNIAEHVQKKKEADDSDTEKTDDEEQRRQAVQYILRAQQLLQQGGQQVSEAQRLFEQALEYDPDNVDAHIGLLRIDNRSEVSKVELASRVDELADRKLSAQQAYDLGLFCLRGLNDRQCATSLLQRVEQKDPSFARRVGVDSLLE